MDNRGIIFAVVAYLTWGVFPIYWKLLSRLTSLEIMSHRWIWAFVFYFVLIIFLNKWTAFIKSFRSLKQFGMFLASSTLIGINWYLYIYAVNSGHILEGSLGYYINPILSLFLGVVFLGEKLSNLKILSGILCFIAVLIMTFLVGETPWISIILALTFALYGFVRKLSKADALVHSTAELVLYLPFVIYYILQVKQENPIEYTNLEVGLVLFSGIMTGVPLLLFSMAAQRIPLYAMAFFQYISPTLQFFCGVFIFHEPISQLQLLAFAFIWTGVLIFIFDIYWKNIKKVKIQTKYSS